MVDRQTRNESNPGLPDAGNFAYGNLKWVGVVGDWDGNGTFTVGVVDPSTGHWYLRNDNSAGPADAGAFPYGLGSWQPLAGAWLDTLTPTPNQVVAANAWLTQEQLQALVSGLQQLTPASAKFQQLTSASDPDTPAREWFSAPTPLANQGGQPRSTRLAGGVGQ